MAFTNGFTNEVLSVEGGENWATGPNIILTATVFEDGIESGLFAKLDAGSLDSLDGSATPAIAGVVLRNVTSAIEKGAEFTKDLYSAVSYMHQGLVTVVAKAGETAPAKFGAVFVSNLGDADDGKATATGTDVATSAEFLEELRSSAGATDGVWLVNIK